MSQLENLDLEELFFFRRNPPPRFLCDRGLKWCTRLFVRSLFLSTIPTLLCVQRAGLYGR